MEFVSHSKTQRRGFVGWERGESERDRLEKVTGTFCRLAAWYSSNLSSADENASASVWRGTVTNWPSCENYSWPGTVGVQLSRWNTLSPSGCSIPSAALTRKEFLYCSSHNKEERERSRAGGRRSGVRGGVHCEGRGGHCLPVAVGNGKAWVIRACLSVFRKCVCVWACVNEWTWLSVCWRDCACVCVWGPLTLGCWRWAAVQRMLKQSWIFFPLSSFQWWLRTDWIPLLFLLCPTLLQGKYGHTSSNRQNCQWATMGLERVWFWSFMVSDWTTQPCDNKWVVTEGFSALVLTKLKITIVTGNEILQKHLCCKYIVVSLIAFLLCKHITYMRLWFTVYSVQSCLVTMHLPQILLHLILIQFSNTCCMLRGLSLQ